MAANYNFCKYWNKPHYFIFKLIIQKTFYSQMRVSEANLNAYKIGSHL